MGEENGSGQSVRNPTFSEINPSTAGRLGYPGRDQWERASQTGPRPGQARLGRQGADWPGAPQGGPHHQSEQLGVHQPRGSQGDQDRGRLVDEQPTD